MFLAKALFGIGAKSQLLALPQPDDDDVILLHVVIGVIISILGCHWDDLGAVGDEVSRRDMMSLVFVSPHVKSELHRALRAELFTHAVPEYCSLSTVIAREGD